MGKKITRSSAKKVEHVSETETESEYDSVSGEEETSMDETSGDEDFIDVSNIFVIIYV